MATSYNAYPSNGKVLKCSFHYENDAILKIL